MCIPSTDLENELINSEQSSILNLTTSPPTNLIECTEIQFSRRWMGGKLIFSDSPEYVNSRGKLYEDGTLDATEEFSPNRIFLYHVNSKDSGSIRFSILITNTDSVKATLKIHRSGIAGPTSNYLYAGKLAFQRWLESNVKSEISVQIGETIRLDTSFDTLDIEPSELLHGIWDYSMGGSHKVTLCALEVEDDPLITCPTLPVLPRDLHVRGTFPFTNKLYESNAGLNIEEIRVYQVPIADGVTDEFSVGMDSTDQTPQTNYGNFGVMYTINNRISRSTKNEGRRVSYLVNPRGGVWGGAVHASEGLLPGGSFLVPSGSKSFSDKSAGTLIGQYNGSAFFNPIINLMPTGGCNLPVRLITVVSS